jgi:hypothetical protein
MNDFSREPTSLVLPMVEDRRQTEPVTAPAEPTKRPLIRWRKLFTLAAIYVTTETALDLAGLDTLASYSEFIGNGQSALQVIGDTIVNLAHLIN